MVAHSSTVLVTGGAGFIGKHVVALLRQKQFRVVVVDIQKNPFDGTFKYYQTDITKRNKVFEIFSTVRPDFVIHLAAVSIVEDAYKDPRRTFEVNVMGTVNILEACRELKGIRGVIVASSDKAYGKTKHAYTENTPLGGDHPYDVSKSSEDLIAQTYYKTYKLPVIITRFGNVYGEGDTHFDRIVPGLCKAVVEKKPLLLRSDGTYVRDYVYVDDVANAYLFLLERAEKLAGDAFNVSSDTNLSVINLIGEASRILRICIPYKILNTAINEIPYQHLDDSKIRKLGWKPRTSFSVGLRRTHAWYKSIA